MSKIIPYSELVRHQQLNFLEHQRRQYREREDYLAGLRKLLFQIEAQMRQAEMQQWQLFKDLAAHFELPLKFPSLGDRVRLQEFFSENEFIRALTDFFAGRTTPEECHDKILALKGSRAAPRTD